MTTDMQLPERTFLDRSIVDLSAVHGTWIVEGEQETIVHDVFTDEMLSDLNALRVVFAVSGRADFRFITAEASIASHAGISPDVHWATQLSVISDELLEVDGPIAESRQRSQRLNDGAYGWMAPKDRPDIRHAIPTSCDAYITTDRKLVARGSALSNVVVHLRLFTRATYWRQLMPWAKLWL